MTESHDPNQLVGAAQDIAPLAWVIDEIRTSLTEATSSVKTFLGNKQDLDSLRSARNHVHQTNGALQLLDLRGVALLTDAVEQLLRRWESEPRECLPAAVRAVESSLSAVRAYLEGLLSGRPNQPIRLYPYYREILILNRAARVHPADLVYPDLSRRPAFHQIEARQLTSDQLRIRRVLYEQGLLGFLRNAEDPRARRQIRDALAELEHMPQRGLARSFWWVIHGLLDALDAGQVPVDVDLKRLLARLNLQLRRLIDGGTLVAERLMVDALYYVGRAGEKVARVGEIKRLYGLEALIPPDFERATLTAVDVEALRSLKEALAQAKLLWGHVVASSHPDPARFHQEIDSAHTAALRLGAGALAQVLERVGSVSAGFAGKGAAVREGLGLEIASALLFAEIGCDELPQLDPEYEDRAKAVAERIDRAAKGLVLPEGVPWMTDLARRAQDRLSMGTVVAETQTTLREIEQRLDRFFRNPAQRHELATVGPMFDQVCGVLSILGYDDPVTALRNVQRSVTLFVDPATPAHPEEFARIAQNLGAIGFFVETLAQDAERPRGMFRYDPVSGVFTADLALAPAAAGGAEAEATPARAAADRHQRHENLELSTQKHLEVAYEQAQRLAAEPGDFEALHELAATLDQLSNDADLLDDAALKTKVTVSARLLASVKQHADRDAAAELLERLAPVSAPAPAPTAPMPATQAAAASELREIFVEEANEVLDSIGHQLARLRAARDDSAALTMARRAFHTLKGSGRMVGLKPFGDTAWAVEQCFNLLLAQERPASEDLLELAAYTAQQMRGWIEHLRDDPSAQIDIGPLVHAAQVVREGGAFSLEADAAHARPPSARPARPNPDGGPDLASSRPPASVPSWAETEPAESGPEGALEAAPAEPAADTFADESAAHAESVADSAADTAADTAAGVDAGAAPAVPVKRPEEAEPEPQFSAIGPALNVFPLDVERAARRADVDEAEAPVEPAAVLEFTAESANDSETGALIASAVPADDENRQIGPIQISHGLYSVFLNESDECIRALAQDIGEWRYEPGHPVHADTVRRAHTLAGIAATVGLTPVSSIADPLDDLLHELSATGGAVHLSPAQFDVLDQVIERVRGMLHQFAAGVYPEDSPLESDAVRDLLSVVRAAAEHRTGGVEAGFDEHRSDETPTDFTPHPTEFAAPGPADTVHAEEHPAPAPAEPPVPTTVAQPAWGAHPPGADLRLSGLRDELDPDLLQVFVTEAHDLLPAIGSGLRALAANPNQREVARELMRHLHTVKGSARMAGAMRLGELVHDMETRIESAMQLVSVPAIIVEDLQGQHDHALVLFDRLQTAGAPASGGPAEAAPQLVGDGAPPSPTEAVESAAMPPGEAVEAEVGAERMGAGAAPAATPFIRVRADVLDKLVDHAGEVSIARSKLESEVGTLRGSLTDLTENIARLRTQLREVEIQADAQIQARSDQLAKQSAAFDPLEFDRYSRLQELTRLLAESVEDVALVQSNMLKGLQTADNDLGSQSRLTRELQQQLMRVRLVPFSNVSERLYRVARQTAKELDKRAQLDIRGASTEIDRGVLERMSGPFEHLVRNAIVHGVESPAQRLARNKPETGELRIDVRQEGNEIVVVFADDGAGLDLDRIRERAVALGMVGDSQRLTERDLVDLIFAPGFSTAEEVTELAGRGVGMDVVRAELNSFGGRIAVSSESGRGTRFTLYLPLTLAITQVVLASVGTRHYALPAAMVELVRRIKTTDLDTALREGTVNFGSLGDVVLRPLAQLLGAEATIRHGHHHAPLVLLRSGEDRLAIAVDHLSTNQEVVVKNVGPQVARLPGILGATVLGNGEIVLIINPIQLIGRAPEPAAFELAPAHEEIRIEAIPAVEAGATIMVVDDSLTVRRVTQRLLERNGYIVTLAKDGVDALRQMQDGLPDVMLVDIEMPRMDGYDLTRNVRANAASRDIPIIMITSRTAEKHRSVALQLGVNEYLGKPYNEEELLRHIRRYLQAREQARAVAV